MALLEFTIIYSGVVGVQILPQNFLISIKLGSIRKNLALNTLDIDKKCKFIKGSTPLWKGNVLWRYLRKPLTYLLSLSMLSSLLIKIDLEFDPSL